MGNKNKHPHSEFKQDAVNYYYSSVNWIKSVAEDLKIGAFSLNNWIQISKVNNNVVIKRGSEDHSSDAEKEIAK